MKMGMQIGILYLALLGLSTALVCPDGGMCEDKNTCCKNIEGGYGCCPLPHAECCSDHLHCCYEGTLCDLIHKKCVNKTVSLPWMRRLPPKVPQESFPLLEKLPARPRVTHPAPTVRSVTCPGGKSSCPDSYTCCLLTSGDYSCCPYPEAMCCSDHLHCCPNNTVCDLKHGVCRSSATKVPLLKKIPAVPNDIECPDRTAACPDQTTCCQSTNRSNGCCPMPNAVCCSDHEHCCPKGYNCNEAEQTCDKPGGLSVSWLQKTLARQKEPLSAVSGPAPISRNMCDPHTSCPKDTTCCFMDKTHKWGCCPLPKAVCCEDGNHCCPSGHSCEPQRSSCSKGPKVIPWLTKLSALTEPGSATDVKCDGQKSCASGTTCCKLPTEEWGCCPLVKAVCCADQEHCCPHGYTCNMQTGTCKQKSHNELIHILPPSKVVKPMLREAEDDFGVTCDRTGDFRCPRQDMCCKMSATEWACCPSPKAVCCSDSKHCCPEGYSCDLKVGGCTMKHTLLT